MHLQKLVPNARIAIGHGQMDEKVLEKVNSYKEELTKKYTNEISKIEREYNRNLFDYEMAERVKVNEFKQNLKSDKIFNQLSNKRCRNAFRI